MFRKIITSIFLLPIILQINAQPIDGSGEFIKESIMGENNISTIVFNYGSITEANRLGNIADFVWRGLGNMFELGPLVAAEVEGENGDTLQIVSDSFVRFSPLQGDYSPDGNTKWGWLPREGYANPDQAGIASSTDPNTWPSEWTEWPGEYGNGVTVGLNEIYYVMDDFSNAEFPYFPFPDTTKRGLGVSAEVRIYQFGSGMKDAVIVKYLLTNESPKFLNEVYFGFHGDPHIGGATDYADDLTGIIGENGISGYEGSKHTFYSWDEDGGGFGGRETGYLAFKLLETPNSAGLTSAHAAQYTQTFPNVPANDELMWEWLSGDIDSTSGLFTAAGDNVLNFGTGPFSLAPGEQAEIKLAIFMSEDFMDMIKDADYIYYHHNWGDIGDDVAMSGGSNDYQVSLDEQASSVNGIVNVTWQYSGTDPNAVAAVEYSSNFGTDWLMLEKNLPIASSYQWDTENHKDGVNYLLRVVSYDPNEPGNYYYDVSDTRFKIDNPAVNAQPELSVDLTFTKSTVTRSPLQINWICEDADNGNLSITLEYYYAGQGPFYLIDNEQFANGNFQYNWDLSERPNANSYYFNLIASDGNSDTLISSGEFEISYHQGIYVDPEITHITGNGTPEIEIEVIDSTAITGDEYEITFNVADEENKTFSIKNNNTGVVQIDSYPLIDNLSTPLFEGLKVKVFDKELSINEELSIFNRSILNSTIIEILPATLAQPELYRGDWAIIFNDLDTASDGSYLFPGDTTYNQILSPVICPFFVKSLPTNSSANFLIMENLATINGIWETGEPIILQPNENPGFRTTYEIKLEFSSDIKPDNGDTLFIRTNKPVQNDDVFRFTSDGSFVTSVKDDVVVSDYYISQNYPNPFNPTTKINFQLPNAGVVNIVVYDILGRKVQTLMNEYRNKGKYTLEFDASKLASGMYIYSLHVNGFVINRKMMLLK